MNDIGILEANRKVHSALVLSGEYQKSPHFLPENKHRVMQKLKHDVLPHLSDQNIKAVDFGCGTGFMIDLLIDIAETVDGVDITQEMLDEVDQSSGKVCLTVAEAENTPFVNNHFDLATAYSFLDHLSDIRVFFEEVFRVLKPGGVFYTGLNPNKAFARLVKSAAENSPEETDANMIVKREVMSMLDNGTYYEEKFGIDKNVLELAESIKTKEGGFDAYHLKECALEVGFSKAYVSFDWFLGQATYNDKPKDIAVIQHYLDKIMPASSPLFKYVSCVFIK